MKDFGIYILTYPKDYHLSAALINSLRYFNPDIPITIIPGNGFDASTYPINDVDVLEKPEGFSYHSEYGYDRKFWCFGGCYERFLYVDADILNMKNIDALVDRIKQEKEPFIFVNLPDNIPDNQDFVDKLRYIKTACREEQRDFHRVRIGNIDNIEKFDPTFDWGDVFGFNGGLWASSKNSFPIEWFNELRMREEAFFTDVLVKPYQDNNLWDLFYGDQGKLTYLASSKNVNVVDLHPEGFYVWGGKAFNISIADLLDNKSIAPFIHWAGVPRPSESWFSRYPLFYFYSKLMFVEYTFREQPEVPARNAWDYFSVSVGKRPVMKTLGDVRRVLYPSMKKMVKSML